MIFTTVLKKTVRTSLISAHCFSTKLTQSAILGFAIFAVGVASTPASALTLKKQIPYYGDAFYSGVASGASDKALIALLQTVLETKHQRNSATNDTVDANCDTASKDCYEHNSLGYNAARKIMMGQIFLSGSSGNYAVRDVYCERDVTNSDYGGADQVGPGKIPQEKVINTEHTWPQSKFSRGFSKELQKSDLHHLFPTDSQMNSERGNHKFAEVDVPDHALKCPVAKIGSIKGYSEEYFEPPTAHKGNVARALFYFSVRYHISIAPEEEAALRKWNLQDPPDAFELSRNDMIYKAQGNRNPFVDYPELADSIGDF